MVRNAILCIGLLCMAALAGCAPFVEYEHLSRPNVRDDGYDLLCLGMVGAKERVSVSAALCENVWTHFNDWHAKGTFVKVNARYTFNDLSR